MGTWVGRYAIVGDEVHEEGPWLAEQLRFSDDERVHLFVLADPADERSAEFCQEIAGAVADLFAGESLSLTGGLLRAMRQAHRNLAEWNRRSLREHRVSIGVTCVALRGDNATIAQTGPGVVYVASPDGVRRVSSEAHDGARPLGGDGPLDPLFTGVSLGGAKILILSSDAAEAAGSAAIGQALESEPDRALAEIFRRTREVRDMTAVLIADVSEGATKPAPVEIDFRESEPTADDPGDAAWQPPAPIITSPAPQPPDRGRRLPTLRRPRSVGAPRSRRRWVIAALLLFAAVLAAAASWYVPSLFESDPAAEVAERLAAADGYLAAAATNDDIAWQRRQLGSALAELEQARAVGTDDPALPGGKPRCSSN